MSPASCGNARTYTSRAKRRCFSHGVPKAIALYKSKIIERLIAEQQALLTDEELPEDNQSEIMARLNRYNKRQGANSQKSCSGLFCRL